MADFRAIAAVSETVKFVLQDNFDKTDFDNNDLQFEIFLAGDFSAKKLSAGVSVFLYRVYPSGNSRRPAGRLSAEGRRERPQLPLDLHFLLTAWAADASLAHRIVGYMMRVMEDFSILPASLLNSVIDEKVLPPVFHPDEAVEVVPSELINEDLLRLWQDLVQHEYELSVPYVARNVYIESRMVLTEGEPVQQRTSDYREMPNMAGSSS
jgi:hypothetical protein